ncbi:hypothetical protein L6259_03930 [Candidatus Parcubacteria bacterium]|nr:hypothetical protein [Candidatus Parcubacteria bacterium]
MKTGAMEQSPTGKSTKPFLLTFSFNNPQSENPGMHIKEIGSKVELTIGLPTPDTEVMINVDSMVNSVNFASYEDEQCGIVQFSSLKQGKN